MTDDWDIRNNPNCPECGARFKDIFEAVDHFIEDDEEFDPALILPGGYKLMIGSLLRSLYENRDNPEFIGQVVQSTYSTLFMAEVNPTIINETIEDFIVESAMEDLDVQLKNLFKNGE